MFLCFLPYDLFFFALHLHRFCVDLVSFCVAFCCFCGALVLPLHFALHLCCFCFPVLTWSPCCVNLVLLLVYPVLPLCCPSFSFSVLPTLLLSVRVRVCVCVCAFCCAFLCVCLYVAPVPSCVARLPLSFLGLPFVAPVLLMSCPRVAI